MVLHGWQPVAAAITNCSLLLFSFLVLYNLLNYLGFAGQTKAFIILNMQIKQHSYQGLAVPLFSSCQHSLSQLTEKNHTLKLKPYISNRLKVQFQLYCKQTCCLALSITHVRILFMFSTVVFQCVTITLLLWQKTLTHDLYWNPYKQQCYSGEHCF